MKYPRYPRYLNRNCKLMDRDIEYIKENRYRHRQKELALKFNISQARVWQILNAEKHKEKRRLYYQNHKELYRSYTPEQRRKVRMRKRLLQNKVQDYYNLRTRVYRKRRRYGTSS